MQRVAQLLVLAGVILLATWVWAPASPAPAPEPRQPRDSSPPDQTAPILEDMAAQIDRLRERIEAPPNFPPPERNPFRFGTKPEPIAPKGRPTLPEAVEPPPPPAPVLPKLLAIVENDVDGVAVRTAVLSVSDDVQVVKVGDAIGRFLVKSIAAGSIELLESSSGTTFPLTLR